METGKLIEEVLKANARKRREIEAVLMNRPMATNTSKVDTRLVSISGAARLMAVGRSTVYKLIRSGRLDTVELNGSPRVTMRSVTEFVSGMRPANETTAEIVAESKARYASGKEA